MNVLFAFISSLLSPFSTFHLLSHAIPFHSFCLLFRLPPYVQCPRFQQPSRLPDSHSIFLHSHFQVKLEFCSTYFNEWEGNERLFRTLKDQSAASITSHVSLPCLALLTLLYFSSPHLLHFQSMTNSKGEDDTMLYDAIERNKMQSSQ